VLSAHYIPIGKYNGLTATIYLGEQSLKSFGSSRNSEKSYIVKPIKL